MGAFRPDIEGLRAIAILFVVLGHAEVPGFSGGFTGVDIFFVISGFLITRLLRDELRLTGQIDFWTFYARRVRRLLPAFALFMFVVIFTLAVWPWGMDSRVQTKSAIFAALWSSNVFFSLNDLDYFAASTRDSVFLHTWSLAVEEQFYLLWPGALWLAWRRRVSLGASLSWFIVVVAVAGLAISVSGTWAFPVAAYFLTPFRLWELAAGGLCSLVIDAQPRLSPSRMRWLGVLGVAAILVSGTFLSEQVRYPGILAMIPVAGSSLLVVLGAQGGALAIWSFLASAPLRFVGRISYGWYLWHWPALVLAKRLEPGSAMAVAFAVFASLLLACLSYWWVEAPLRRRVIENPKRLVQLGVMGSLTLAGLAAVVRPLSLEAPGSAGLRQAHLQALQSQITMPAIYSIDGCDDWYGADRLVPCVVGDTNPGARKVVVLGDSVGLQWFPALQQIFAEKGWSLTVLTKSSCPIIDESFYYERIKRRYTECETWRESATSFVQQQKPDLLIVGSAGTYAFTPSQWLEGARRELQALKQGAKKIVVLAPTPRLGFDGPSCVANHFRRIVQEGGGDDCSVPLADAENRAVIEILAKVAGTVQSTALISLNELACPGGRCRAWSSGHLAFRDDQHLNASYVESLAPAIALRFAPLLDEPAPQVSPDR